MVHIPPKEVRASYYAARYGGKYRLIDSYVGKTKGLITFDVPWEEYLEGNQLYIHWGVFSYENATTTDSIIG